MLKYNSQIENIKSTKGVTCVTSDYSEKNNEAFRWTFEDIADERNFRPRALDPTHPKPEVIKLECGGWSLSMFVSEEKAVLKLHSICKDKPNLSKKLGTHVATGTLEKRDGLSGEFRDGVDGDGHFEFFEYVGIDLSKKFKVIRKVF